VAPSTEDGLDVLLATARACAGGAPHFGEGLGGSPLLLDHAMVLRPDGGGAWTVHFAEEAPTTAPYGRAVVVDPVRRTCDGDPVARPAGDPGPSTAALADAAWQCARSLGATGVGGSPLVRDGLSLTLREDGRILASVPEAEPTTRPAGRDVLLDRTGTGCRAAVMD